MSAVRPEFGPTLPELVRPRLRALPRAARIAVLAVAGVLLAVLVWALLLRGDGTPERRSVVVARPVAFNFGYRAPLARFAPAQGGLARVASPGLSFTVRELRLPPFRGDSAGVLPLYASLLTDEMRQTFDGFVWRQEGRTNVNRQQGYEILFQFRQDGRTRYGRRVLLLPEPTAHQGADLLLLADRSSAVPSVGAVGRNGPLKTTLYSFRFGTDTP